MVSIESPLRSRPRDEGLEKTSYLRSFRAGVVSLIFGIYKFILSPFIHAISGVGFGCRFAETCSVYGQRIIKEKGIFIGLPLLVKRIISCNPWVSNKQETCCS